MILRSLKLENFGLFRGVAAFDLAPRNSTQGDTPIILVGGRNGAGKTTFLDALRLALYGKRALGTRVGQSEYEQHLRSRVHRAAGIFTSAVSLEFDYAESGVVHRYVVRREWSVRGEAVAETIELEKDGATITSVPREEWHHFLQELIPPGLSQLFFFDGERIQEFADGTGEEEYLGDAVRGLLGIELVNRLRTDLALYLARHRASCDQSTDSIGGRIEANIRDIVVAQRRADELFEEAAEIASRRDSLARVAEQARRRFVAEGGEIALGRARLEVDIEENKRALQKAETEFRDLSNKLLPFIYAPNLIARFRSALGALNANDIDIEALERIFAGLADWSDASAVWTREHRRDVMEFVSSKRTKNMSFVDLPDRRTALATLDSAMGETADQAATISEELGRYVAKSGDLARSLSRADSAASGVMLDDLREADRKVGLTEASLLAKQEELKTVRNQVAMLEREQERLLEEQARESKSARQNDLGLRTAKVLMEYEFKLLTLKLKQLQTEFLRCFAYLARKSDLVGDVTIDVSTFAVTLLDAEGDVLPKSQLSAGERQIYATAMLWALARTSGRHLPMIIDTPLARLDTEHRARLLELYFPAASHQVILLSTDTEIDAEASELLKPYVSHSFLLEYDSKERRSTVSPGYFISSDEEGDRALQQA